MELAVLILAAVGALLFQLTLPGKLVDEQAYRALADTLGREAKPGDVLLLFPWWTERARLFVPPSLPVVGYLGSDTDPLRSFARIWLLAQPRLPKANLSDFLSRFGVDRASLSSPRQFGNLQLSLYQNALFRPQFFDAANSYAAASVYLQLPDGSRRPCPFEGTTHRCPGPPELHVAAEWHELRYRPARCLWMHPPGGATRLVAEFSDFPFRSWVRLEGGMTWDRGAFQRDSITPVYAGLEDQQGKELFRLEFPPGADEARSAQWRVPAGSPPTGTIRLWVQSANPELRDFCVQLFSEGRAAADPR